jgi:hypothetical protein
MLVSVENYMIILHIVIQLIFLKYDKFFFIKKTFVRIVDISLIPSTLLWIFFCELRLLKSRVTYPE